jgi:dipeptidase D
MRCNIAPWHSPRFAGKPSPRPNPASPLLALCQQVFRQTFQAESAVQVIHAGLDTVSFGPNIRGAHAPGERVEVSSVARCWTLFKALIGEHARTA